ncbi:MAG: 23S rRNA (guanosine(2251)-2'-O)-methyltransferase RlmB [Elusimicrobiota bacterium]|jgi:23S rRNA (guanosine2251-2'-O)-methyltransferase|nr:23S rRNA (guanosine(2251)-2'-O)-methyltransferase RlmB [Elusimicrobiota bacterium]
MSYKKNNQYPKDETGFIYGRNPILEILKSDNRTVNKLLLSKTARGHVISEIISFAKSKSIAIHNVPPEKLENFPNSQGVAAEVSPIKYKDLKDMIKQANKADSPLLVILDGIEDPHNLGAIVRNCTAFGANGIIIPKWRCAAVNATVSKASAGAIEHISISRVANINQAVDKLKEQGFWIAGTENGVENIENVKLTFPLAVIIGSEGTGMHNLTRKKCDFLISIEQSDAISSINASCASSIILYELFKLRKTQKCNKNEK